MLLALGGFVIFQWVAPMVGEQPTPTWFGTGLGLVAFGALAHRRMWPFPVLLVTVGVTATQLLTGGGKSALMLASTIGVYTVAANIDRRLVVAKVGVGSAVLLGTAGTIGSDGHWASADNVGLVLQCALAAAVGAAVQNKRAYLTEVERRARVAEETKEQEARRRVAEERLRIARDLHDVLAHHIAVINVQAGVAAHVLEDDVGQAHEALGHVRRAGQDALNELRVTVGVLRRPDGEPPEPAPGLDRLPQLIASFEKCGLKTRMRADGDPAPVPVPVELAAYRIVQEALTNVTKHSGADQATVRLEHRPGELAVEISDRGRGNGKVNGSGHGLVGMRERALALGGTFAAAPRPDGGFQVLAVLPVTR
ncbi:sensor histidine kinase [Actinomadura fulvescens]